MRKRRTSETCGICGEIIDKTACNEDRGIFTLMTDSDEAGTKTERVHICNDCVHGVYADILARMDGSRYKILEEINKIAFGPPESAPMKFWKIKNILEQNKN